MAISPSQLARVHTQLNQVMKQISAGELQAAGRTITQLVRKYPSLGETNHVASGYYAHVNERDRAIYYAEHAVKIEPKNAGYHVALGVLWVQKNKHKDAVKHLEQALELDSKTQQVKGALAVSYAQLGRVGQARKMFNQAIADSPDDYESAMNLALLESDVGNAHRAVEIMRSVIDRFPGNPLLRDSLCMFATYDDQLSPDEIFDIHKQFGQCIQPHVRVPKSYANTPDPDRKIRIGFVSPDLNEHSIAYFVEPLFKHLDRTKFELCLYHTSSQSDEVSKRFELGADLWRSCTEGITQTHKQIVQDQVDVLIELTGHFASNLLPLFSAKPTPVSVSTIGYANTTGLDSIDARIVDSITDPSPDTDKLATEQLIRMPGCFLCYRPPLNTPPVDQCDIGRAFTFGSFNDLRKISSSTLDVWAKILLTNPESMLLLKSSRFGDQMVCSEFLLRFEERGIDQSRLILKGRTESLQDHLAIYNQIDCALDTFPYAGTTTTCESLWMGVPVITLLGKAHAGRVGASLLKAVGQDDQIAETHQEYIDQASKQASKGPRLSDGRESLRKQMKESKLCDEESYTRKFETIVQVLWDTWCQSQGANQ